MGNETLLTSSMSSSGFVFRALISTSRQLQDTTAEGSQSQAQPSTAARALQARTCFGKEKIQAHHGEQQLGSVLNHICLPKSPPCYQTTVSPLPNSLLYFEHIFFAVGLHPLSAMWGHRQEMFFHVGRVRNGERGHQCPPAAAFPLCRWSGSTAEACQGQRKQSRCCSISSSSSGSAIGSLPAPL